MPVEAAQAGIVAARRSRFGTRIAIIYAVCFILTLCAILYLTGDRFSYALDDSYIHLALAQNIAHGHYGLNAGEATSPSSSAMWPLLLVPFTALAQSAWVPLVFNALLSLAICALLGVFFHRWYFRLHFRELQTPAPRILLWVIAFLFMVAANLIGLTFIGMEHVLQILLIVGCAMGMMEAYTGEPISTAYLVMAALAPAVRYEDLAFTLGIAAACWMQRRRVAALLTFGLSLAPLLAFSLFLHAQGLAYLPNSVLVKGGIPAAQKGLFAHVRALIVTNLTPYLSARDHLPMTALLLAMVILAYVHRHNRRRFGMLLCALIPVVLMMTIGPYGWFFRYDVCSRLFAFLIVFGVLAQRQSFSLVRATLLTFLAASIYFIPLVKTPFASLQTEQQQHEMARFAHDFYKQDIAVNDLGWVSFDKSRQVYVLDLWGLASTEAMVPVKDAAWLAKITTRHHIGLVMIYTDWYKGIPSSWIPIAELHMKPSRFHREHALEVVSFYATPFADLPSLRREVAAFAATLPSGTWITTPPQGEDKSQPAVSSNAQMEQ